MADAYNEPELRAWYCSNECPLGKDCREIPEMPPERALLRLKNAIGEIDGAMDTLSLIMDDGLLDEGEKPLIPQLREQFLEARRRVDENLATLEKAERIGKFD
jgi:hypothetical protein